jgi:glutamate racemase
MGPIGIFDSGYGGLTILQDIRKELPEYDYLYLGDNARAPYGSRSFDRVFEFTLQAVQELFDRGCEMVILACNTSSAKALRNIQQNFLPESAPDKRVLGVLRPSTEVIGQFTNNHHIGILATQGTVSSDSYVIEIKKFSPQSKVHQHACPLWVPLIENNEHTTEAGREFIKKDVEKLLLKNKNIDTILLACTHYPVLKGYIETIVPNGVAVISQGKIVAKSLADYLLRHPIMDSKCTKNGTVHFLTTENHMEFDKNASHYMDDSIHSTTITLPNKIR